MRFGRMGALLGLGAALSAAGCETDEQDTLGPNVAASVAVSGGDDQADVLGDTLGEPVEVRVTNRRGNPVSGATVTWAVTAGGGSVSPATSVTDDDGLATARWVLGGGQVGRNELTAAVDGVSRPAVFEATAIAQSFSANLTGAQVRPTAVTTNAAGTAQMTWNGSQLNYLVAMSVPLSSNVVRLHIHGPQRDSTLTAPAIFDFKPTAGVSSGNLAAGTAERGSDHRLTPTISLDSLVALLRNRAAYVDVHTVSFPDGEVRGQVKTP